MFISIFENILKFSTEIEAKSRGYLQRWKCSLMKKTELLIQYQNTFIFWLFGRCLTHFISKYFAKKKEEIRW